MSDPFAILGLPRRPWLDDGVVRTAFQDRARQCHPDAHGGDVETFATLNAAHSVLKNPASRLRLLIGATELPGMPAEFLLGFRVAETVRRVNQWCEKESAGGNVLTRALLAGEAGPLGQEIEQVTSALEALRSALDERLQAIDQRWPEGSKAELAALAGEYVFLDRWQEKLKEGRLALEIAFGKSEFQGRNFAGR